MTIQEYEKLLDNTFRRDIIRSSPSDESSRVELTNREKELAKLHPNISNPEELSMLDYVNIMMMKDNRESRKKERK